MNTNINNLLTTAYELEGLLLVIQRHKGDVPQEVIDRFKEKAEVMAREAKLIERQQAEEPVHSSQPVQQPPALDEKPQPPATKEISQPPSIEQRPMSEASTPPPFKSKRDITAEFSINDRFLFQRELFDDDAEKFNATIAKMQDMRDLDQIQRFMTDVLEWNTGDYVVKEFVRLISKAFNQDT